MPIPPVPSAQDQTGSWANCNQQATVSAANNTYNSYVQQTVNNFTTDESNTFVSQVFNGASVTPTLVTGAIVLATQDEQAQAASNLLAAAVDSGALTTSVSEDPTQETTEAIFTVPSPGLTQLDIAFGGDVLQAQFADYDIEVAQCGNESLSIPVALTDAGAGQLQMFQWMCSALSQLLLCCNPCEEQQETTVASGPLQGAGIWTPGGVGAAQPDFISVITVTSVDAQFPVDSTFAQGNVSGIPPNLGKYGRFCWRYPTGVFSDPEYFDLLNQSFVVKDAPVGIAYWLYPGVTIELEANLWGPWTLAYPSIPVQGP